MSQHPLSRSFAATLIVVVLTLPSVLAAAGITPNASTAGSPWAGMSVRAANQINLREPAPFGSEVSAGPWRMQVLDVLTGEEATELVTAASPFNDLPRDGFTYVAVRLGITNNGDQPLTIQTDDFAITGGSGSVRRFTGAFPPDPAIDQVVAPGENHEGWAVLGAPSDENDLVLLYDSLSIPGNWADRAFALTPDVALPAPSADIPSNDVGTDPADPAPAGAAVATDDWQVEVLDVVIGDPVYALYPPSDYRTTALGEAAAWDPNDADADGAVGWLAMRVEITSLDPDQPLATLPATAFMLAGENGAPIPNTLFLTPPRPDASGPYIAGVPREGWVAFELPGGYDVTTVRFLPYRTDTDARYFDVAA